MTSGTRSTWTGHGLFRGGVACCAGEPGGTAVGDGNLPLFRCFSGGTDISNPVPSSGESTNLRSRCSRTGVAASGMAEDAINHYGSQRQDRQPGTHYSGNRSRRAPGWEVGADILGDGSLLDRTGVVAPLERRGERRAARRATIVIRSRRAFGRSGRSVI
jgi:hypothetical protein